MNLPVSIQRTLQWQPFKPYMRENELQRLSPSLETKYVMPIETCENNDGYDVHELQTGKYNVMLTIV